jgi:hypothetical protein
VACTTSTCYGASLTTGQMIVFGMHLLAATVAGIYICVHICVFLAAFLGLISLEICLLPTCILLAYLVWWWLWGMSLVVSAVRWPCRLIIQFWAGVGHIMAYEYARGRQQGVQQVCLVSVAWLSMDIAGRSERCPSLSGLRTRMPAWHMHAVCDGSPARCSVAVYAHECLLRMPPSALRLHRSLAVSIVCEV